MTWYDTSQTPQRAKFDPRPVHMGFVVDQVTLGQNFLQALQFSCTYNFTSSLHLFIHLPVTSHNLNN